MNPPHATDTRLVARFANRSAAKKGLDAVLGHGGIGAGQATLLCRHDRLTPETTDTAAGGLGVSVAKGAAVGLAVGAVLGLAKGVTIGGSLGIENYDVLLPVLGAISGALTGGLHLGYGWMGATFSREVAENRCSVAVDVDTEDGAEVVRLTTLLRHAGATDVQPIAGEWAAHRGRAAVATG